MAFTSVSRNEFREFFQPSRLLTVVVKAPNESGVNITPVAFNMHCSYDPPMMAFALEHSSYSCELLKKEMECALSVPGQSLAQAIMFCGSHSGRTVDKVKRCRLSLATSETISTPAIADCIANIEVVISAFHQSGDHTVFLGTVMKYQVRPSCHESGLLSIGSTTDGYNQVAKEGIHRLAVSVLAVSPGEEPSETGVITTAQDLEFSEIL